MQHTARDEWNQFWLNYCAFSCFSVKHSSLQRIIVDVQMTQRMFVLRDSTDFSATGLQENSTRSFRASVWTRLEKLFLRKYFARYRGCPAVASVKCGCDVFHNRKLKCISTTGKRWRLALDFTATRTVLCCFKQCFLGVSRDRKSLKFSNGFSKHTSTPETLLA